MVSTAHRLRDEIEGLIVTGVLAPGEKLDEVQLANRFAVSRTPIREALRHLAAGGLVVLRPNRGAQVPEPTRAEGAHVFDARRVVECEVVRRLAGALDKSQVTGLKRLVDAEERATAAGDHREAIRLSGAFHVELARLSGNPLFVRMLEELLPTTSLLMALYKPAGEPMCVAHSHRVLLGKLEADSAAAAATEMRRHLNEIERSLDAPAARATPALRDVFAPYREGG